MLVWLENITCWDLGLRPDLEYISRYHVYLVLDGHVWRDLHWRMDVIRGLLGGDSWSCLKTRLVWSSLIIWYCTLDLARCACLESHVKHHITIPCLTTVESTVRRIAFMTNCSLGFSWWAGYSDIGVGNRLERRLWCRIEGAGYDCAAIPKTWSLDPLGARLWYKWFGCDCYWYPGRWLGHPWSLLLLVHCIFMCC